MAVRCRFCGEVVTGEEAPRADPSTLAAWQVAARALCPECAEDEIEEILRQGPLSPPAPAPVEPTSTRCPTCGRADSLRPLTPAEARTYAACGGDGYSPGECARVVMVRYGIEA